MQRIGIIYNPTSTRSQQLSQELRQWLEQEYQHNIWWGTSDQARELTELVQQFDLLISCGGDGTALRTARLAIPYNIPVLTVGLGRLNFLAELAPEAMQEGVAAFLAGKGWYEQRTLLRTTLLRDEQELYTAVALNEMVLSRGDINRIVEIAVEIDDIPLITYRSDGVLVSTATGSTAYALAAGGPVVDPRSKSLVLVPIAAHLTAVPALVLHEDTIVRLTKLSPHKAALSVDGGDSIPILQNDVVLVRRSRQMCMLARVNPPRQLYASFVRGLRRE